MGNPKSETPNPKWGADGKFEIRNSKFEILCNLFPLPA
jgi:hypothetical protein